MLWICEVSIGVSAPGRPVTAFIDMTGTSPSNSVSTAAAMFTWTRFFSSSGGSQRQRSMFALIWRSRASTGTLSAASVCAATIPVGLSP